MFFSACLTKGIDQNVVSINATACLGQSEGCGILIKISSELIHGQGIDGLVGSILQVFWDEGVFKGFTKFLEGFVQLREVIIYSLIHQEIGFHCE